MRKRSRTEDIDISQKKYKAKNKEYYNNYQKTRRKNDICFKLAGTLRSRLTVALGGNQKSGSAVKDLGCSVSELKLHLESKFYNNSLSGEEMNWLNHGQGAGKWQIDHIEELHTVDLSNRDTYLRVCNFKNLQPLWHEDHIIKSLKVRYE